MPVLKNLHSTEHQVTHLLFQRGEMTASGSKHADNVAAVLLGGCTFVKNSNENDYFKLIDIFL